MASRSQQSSAKATRTRSPLSQPISKPSEHQRRLRASTAMRPSCRRSTPRHTRRHGVAPNQLFTWRRLVAQGLTAAGSGEEVVPASDYRALQSQVRELQRMLGKKTLEAEILKEAWKRSCPFLPFSKEETFPASVSVHEFNAGSL